MLYHLVSIRVSNKIKFPRCIMMEMRFPVKELATNLTENTSGVTDDVIAEFLYEMVVIHFVLLMGGLFVQFARPGLSWSPLIYLTTLVCQGGRPRAGVLIQFALGRRLILVCCRSLRLTSGLIKMGS